MSEEKGQSGAPDFNKLEEEVLQFWEQSKTFEKSLEQTKDGEPFVFYDGPPFATGVPHYGHILGSTVKDLFGRYQTMRGKYVRRVWGWDCHGLPIENIVEKKLGISGKKQILELGEDKFNESCRNQVLEYADEWGKMVRRMGRWVDFQNSYKTMDTSFQESVWWALKQLWDKNLVYEDRKVLLYCSRCETPISNFEVAMDNSYQDVTENSVFVKFRLLPRQRILDHIVDEKTFVLAWTTTPWTLPGNTALNIGGDIAYVLVSQNDEKFVLAKERLEVLEGEYEVLLEFSARSLEGLQYEPLYPGVLTPQGVETVGDFTRAHKIYIENFVTTEDGTGVVHNAAMYGEEDYEAAKNRNLPRVDMLDHKGEYLDVAPEFLRGRFFKDADKIVLKDLKERGLVYKLLPFTHSYPHCHRCGTPLFYNALPAWFINIQKIKPELLEANESIDWYPNHLKHGRFKNSVEGAPDWNISRNRFWATALPFWKCQDKQCGKITCIGSVAELKEKSLNFAEVYPEYRGEVTGGKAESSFDLNKLDLHKPYIDRVFVKCEKCGGKAIRIPEVVDCWVESGSMPFAELHAPFENEELFKQRMPADFVAEYIAQTRAWFYVMHVVSVGIFGKAPFRNVVTTGTILAEDGSKMSKSKNNFPDPWQLLEKFGVDALRFYLMLSSVMNGDDLNFSEKGVREVYQKVNMLLYNIHSFYALSLEQVGGAGEYGKTFPAVKHVMDVWILERLKLATTKVTQYLDAYSTPKASRELVEFINDLSTWYVRRSRERIKAGGEDGVKALEVLGYVLRVTAQLLAPISPFLADHVFRGVLGQESVHLSTWPTLNEPELSKTDASGERVLTQMSKVREIVSLALAARKNAGVSVRQPLAAFAYQFKDGQGLPLELQDIMLEELNIKECVEFDSLEDKQKLKGGIEAAGDENLQVLLDTNLTPELEREGQVRELERAVQGLRKKAGLKVGEEVDLYYNTQDESLEALLLGELDKTKTSVRNLSRELEVEADEEAQAEVSGRPIWLGVVKI